ncbi:MAG: CDP-alcohol phosphatidyltransferase family protein [Desulfobacterales bacterium]|jgi:CDP-diacylglycerol--glycerol-3-phosphate 3-phosphatidyltransferase
MLEIETISRQGAVEDGSARCRLQTAWWMACLFCLLFLLGGLSCLYFVWQPFSAFQWLLTAAAINAYVLWLLWTAMGKNHSLQNAVLQPDLGIANWLTIARAFLIGALGGFLFQGPPGISPGSQWLIWLPGILYIVAVLLDYLDGLVARLMRSETRLGEWLDTKIDALGLLVAPVVAIGYDRLPVYYISVSLAYYLFQFGIWHRKQNNQPVIELRPHPVKRMIAGFQMGLVIMALLPVFSPTVMTIAASIFMIPLLAGFLRDALVAGGYVSVNHLQQTRWDPHIAFVSTKFLPLMLRLFIVLTGMVFLYKVIVAPVTGDHRAAMLFNPAALPLFATAALMIAVGFMARIAALLISIVAAGILTAWGSPFSLFLLLPCALTLMLTGSGMGSLWQPEDRLFLERQGHRPSSD